MKKKILLVSIITIVLCISVIAGSTFALFTKKAEVNIAVTAGELNVKAEIQTNTLNTKSLGKDFPSGDSEDPFTTDFPNGGKATFDSEKLSITNMTPGDAVTFDVVIENTGDIALAYSFAWASAFDSTNNTAHKDKKDMFEALSISVAIRDENGVPQPISFIEGTEQKYWTLGDNGVTNDSVTLCVTVEFTNDDDNNDFQSKDCIADVMFTVYTVQLNGIDTDGTLITTP